MLRGKRGKVSRGHALLIDHSYSSTDILELKSHDVSIRFDISSTVSHLKACRSNKNQQLETKEVTIGPEHQDGRRY